MSKTFQSDTEVVRMADAAVCLGAADMQPLAVPARRLSAPPWKRSLDLTCIIFASPLLLPLGLLIALAIKLLSRGPVLFRQTRIGLFGKPFTCLKFRTMLVDADTSVHQGHLNRLMTSNAPMTKLDAAGDPRLISGGLWLRSLGLDELPQIINVLRGEMSLVGPRPCVPYEYQAYLPRHRHRCATLPGLTGYWQVNGKNRTTFEEMMDMDLYYVKKKSLVLDFWIMAMTIPALLGQFYDVRIRRKKFKV